jgi:TonB-linked SusC/RagA family outer membrane protein
LAFPVLAQQARVTGKIVDEGGQPVVGVWVQVVGTSKGVLTGSQGTYILSGLEPGSYQLRAVAVGFTAPTRNVTVRAGETTTLDWTMRAIPFALDEVVVTATGGQQLTRELGNTIGKIEAAALAENAPVTNITQVLSGRVAGVNVMQSNGSTGQGARIRIRGLSSVSLSNDPVIVIDGVRVASEAPAGAFNGGGRVSHINDLNPEEIESIEIVKGPSAATLYGTQAANGVVRITTKRGSPGTARWNVWLEGGLLKDVDTYPSTWFSSAVGSTTASCLPYQAAAGTCQIAALHKLSLLNDKETTPFGTGNRQQGGVSVSGGSETVRYFVSGEYERELGLLKMADREVEYLRVERGTSEIPFEQRRPNELEKFSGRINLGATLAGGKLDLSVSSGYINNDIRLAQTGDNFQSVITSAATGSANPTLFPTTGGYGFSRPADGLGEVTWRRNAHFLNSATATWQPRSWLTARGTVGLDRLDYTDEQNVLNGQGCKTCTTPASGSVERLGKRMLWDWVQSKYTVDLNTTASVKLTSRIGSKTSLGAQYNYDKLFGVQSEANILPPGALTLTAGAIKTLTESTAPVRTIGQYVEQQFSLDDRLFVNGGLRVDANSAFGRDSRSATYPKVSASWVAIEGRSGWLNDVRPRIAYGQSGQQPTPLAALTYDQAVTASIFNSANTPGVVLGAVGDPALKPERSAEIEGGADFGFLDNRVRLGVTLYDKTTKDALVNRNIALSLGATQTRIENIGEINNKGIEVSLNVRVLDSPNLGWDLQLEAAGNKNRLVSLGPGVPPLVGFGFKNIPGYPMFGHWQQELKSWSDANNDGFIGPTEVVVSDTLEFLGSSVPTRTANLTSNWTLLSGRVQLMAMGEYKGGYSVLNVNNLFACAFQRNCRALHDPTAPLADQAAAQAGARAFGAYVEDGTFVRLREASVTYHAPSRLASYLRASSAAVTFTGRNLLMWTAFNSWDPENVTQSQDGPNYNFGQQAQPLTLILRLNLGY